MEKTNEEQSESSEEMRTIIERYHKLLIEREKEHSLMIGQRLGPISAAYSLKRNGTKFLYALIIQAGLRLSILVALWIAILSVAGFSARSFLIMSISLVLYAALEAFEILGKLKLVSEAIE